MSTTPSPISRRTLVWILLAVAGLAVVWFVVASISRGINQALSPLRQSNSALETQVANILHPTPTIIPDPVTIVHEVRALAKLETIQYSVEKVITGEENQGVLGPLFGDRLLFVAHGSVIAGIDLQKLGTTDLWLQNGVLNVRLPQAEIFNTILDNDKSYVYDRQTGLLSKGDPNLETAVRQTAVQEIQQAALDDGILALAQQNAETYLARLFQTLGYPDVLFATPSPTP